MSRFAKSSAGLTPAKLRQEGVKELAVVGQFYFVLTAKRLVVIPGGGANLNRLRDLPSVYQRWQELRSWGYRTLEVADMYGVPEAEVISHTDGSKSWKARTYHRT